MMLVNVLAYIISDRATLGEIESMQPMNAKDIKVARVGLLELRKGW